MEFRLQRYSDRASIFRGKDFLAFLRSRMAFMSWLYEGIRSVLVPFHLCAGVLKTGDVISGAGVIMSLAFSGGKNDEMSHTGPAEAVAYRGYTQCLRRYSRP